MDSNIKVSVIIPVYNDEKFLELCLNSVTSQTLKEIEIICVDDCSSDNSLKMLKEYAEKDNRIVVIEQEHNQGQGAARNKGIEAANGEYITFVDHDDYIDSNLYEEMYNQAKRLDSEIVICDVEKHNEKTGKSHIYRCFENVISPFSVIKIEFPVNQNIDKGIVNETLIASPGMAWNKIYKREFINRYNIRFSDIMYCEDVMFSFRSQFLAKKISYTNNVVYHYNVRQTSTTNNLNNRYKYAKTIYSELNKYLKNIGQKNFFAKNLKYFRIINALITYKTNESKEVRKYILKDLKHWLEKDEYKIFLQKCDIQEKSPNLYHISKEKNHKVISLLNGKIRIKIKKKNFNMPVDIVYCWVNGYDENWQKEKNKWQKELNIPNTDAVNMCRFSDNEELKYSLRSIAKNAKWINHIYIITNGQAPEWLDTSHPKITIVRHEDIMPKDALPVFSAYPIETSLANIPELSEHFLYANDDFYIYSPVKKDYFFDEDGNPIIRYKTPTNTKERLKKELYLQNVFYSANLIKNKFGKKYNLETTHNIDSYRKSYFFECKEAFKKEFEETLYSKFSRKNLVQRTIVNMFMLCCKSCKSRKLDISVNKKSAENLCINLQTPEKMEKIILENMSKLKLFCINDNEKALQENREKLSLYLSSLFPKKQDWEK